MITKWYFYTISAKKVVLLFTAKLAWKPACHFREHASSYSTSNWNALLKQDLIHMTKYTEISACKMINKPFEWAFTMDQGYTHHPYLSWQKDRSFRVHRAHHVCMVFKKCCTCGCPCQTQPVVTLWEGPSSFRSEKGSTICSKTSNSKLKLQKVYMKSSGISYTSHSAEKQQCIVLMWGKENNQPCRSTALWHRCENKMCSFWGMVFSHNHLQFLIL